MKQVKYEPTNKYIQCYCDKRQIIQLGWGYLFYAYILVLIFFPLFLGAYLILLPINWEVLFLIGFFMLFLYSFRFTYTHCYRDMIKAGHTPVCSKKVALKAMWHDALYSHYEIDVNPKKVDPQGSYGTAVIGVWTIAWAVNGFCLIQFAYDGKVSVVYPFLFMAVIVLSVTLLVKIKNMRGPLLAICVLNIISSGMLLTYYVLGQVVAAL